MASDNEASCVSDPNFAVICSFLECFGKSCAIDYPDIATLQKMLEDTHEVAQQLIDLHIKLMRKIKKSVSSEKWERALVKFCHSYSNQDGWELERFGYKKARLGVKLRLLKVLLESQFDLNQKFKNEVNKLAAKELRLEPLGRDKTGLAYWYQLDDECNIRVYREDIDEESWELVANDREGVVNLVTTLSDGEAVSIPLNDDSNSLEISEKPIIDTGQVSSPSLEEDTLQENGDASHMKNDIYMDKTVNNDNSQKVGMSDKKLTSDDEDAEEASQDQDDDDDDDDEDEDDDNDNDDDLSNDEASKENTDEDSQDSVNDESDESSIDIKVPVQQKKKMQDIPRPEQKLLASHDPQNTEKDLATAKTSVIKLNTNELTPLKSIETPVIKTSPLKVVNVAELKNITNDQVPDIPSIAPFSLIKSTIPSEDLITPSPLKTHEKVSLKNPLPFVDPMISHPKFPIAPINQLAANLVRMQSGKLEKPSASKLLEKIAENLARSSSAQVTAPVINSEDDKFPSDLSGRVLPEKLNISSSSSPSSRGMDLSTSPRGWESTNDHHNRRMDFSGIDLSSRHKAAKPVVDIPLPGYRPQDFQFREMDLSTRKVSKPELPNLPYDPRATMLRNHTMVTDLSKRQMPFVGYDMPSTYHSAGRIPSIEEHRLPASYALLPDPNKLAAMRSGPAKRVLETEDPQQGMLKRLRTDLVPMRGLAHDKKTPLASGMRRDDVGPAIQEPLMIINGEGSGSDCETGNSGIGEAIEEPVIFFYGQGSGHLCNTGNPGDETSTDNKESNESKTEGCSEVATKLSPQTKIPESDQDTETSKVVQDDAKHQVNSDCAETTSNCQSTEVEKESLSKSKFKVTLGVQVITKTTGGGSTKRLSRWDVGAPEEKPECDSSMTISNDENISLKLSVTSDAGFKAADDTKDIKLTRVESKIESDVITSSTSQICSSTTDTAENKTDEKSTICSELDSTITEEDNENLTSSKSQCDPSAVEPMEVQSSEAINAPESTETTKTPPSDEPDDTPKFFFGPNCVSFTPSTFGRENSDDKATCSSMHSIKQKAEENPLTTDNNNSVKSLDPLIVASESIKADAGSSQDDEQKKDEPHDPLSTADIFPMDSVAAIANNVVAEHKEHINNSNTNLSSSQVSEIEKMASTWTRTITEVPESWNPLTNCPRDVPSPKQAVVDPEDPAGGSSHSRHQEVEPEALKNAELESIDDVCSTSIDENTKDDAEDDSEKNIDSCSAPVEPELESMDTSMDEQDSVKSKKIFETRMIEGDDNAMDSNNDRDEVPATIDTTCLHGEIAKPAPESSNLAESCNFLSVEPSREFPSNENQSSENEVSLIDNVDSSLPKSESIVDGNGREIESCKIADSSDAFVDDLSDNPSVSADQDSNELMVIDDRISDSMDSEKITEDKRTSCEIKLENEEAPQTEPVKEQSTSVYAARPFEQVFHSAEQMDTVKAPMADSNPASDNVLIPRELTPERSEVLASLEKACEAVVSQASKTFSDSIDMTPPDHSSKPSLLSQASLVANYDSNDSNNTGSDDVFEAESIGTESREPDEFKTPENESCIHPLANFTAEIPNAVSEPTTSTENIATEVTKIDAEEPNVQDDPLTSRDADNNPPEISPTEATPVLMTEEPPVEESCHVDTSDITSEKVPEIPNQDPENLLNAEPQKLEIPEQIAKDNEIENIRPNNETEKPLETVEPVIDDAVPTLSKDISQDVSVADNEYSNSNSCNNSDVNDVDDVREDVGNDSFIVPLAKQPPTEVAEINQTDCALEKPKENQLIQDTQNEDESFVPSVLVPVTNTDEHVTKLPGAEESGIAILDNASDDICVKENNSTNVEKTLNVDLQSTEGVERNMKEPLEECKPNLTVMTTVTAAAVIDSSHDNKVDIKKEASKRLHISAMDTEDIPPFKSKPSVIDFVKDEPLAFANDIKVLSDEKPVGICDESTISVAQTVPLIYPILEPDKVEIDMKREAVNQVSPNNLIKAKDTHVEISEDGALSGVKSVEEDSDSMDISNDGMFETAENDVDPLALPTDNLSNAVSVEEKIASSVGVHVKPVNEIQFEGWKLDAADEPPVTPKPSRKRRNSSHNSNSDDGTCRQDDEDEMMGGKRIKLRGKRSPDMALRKSVENSRIQGASSEDEAPTVEPTGDVNEIKEEGQMVQDVIPIKSKAKKSRRRKVSRFKKRTSRHKKSDPTSAAPDTLNVVASDGQPIDDASVSMTNARKKRKKRKMVLGLEIGIDIAVSDCQGDLTPGEAPVRQSRRIAQIKIKEEADRRRIEEETLEDGKGIKKDRDSLDKKKKKKQKTESDEDAAAEEWAKESEKESQKKKKRKKKKKEAKFNEAKPWQSSSGSSTEEEDENEDDDEDEIESEGSLLFKSDHEFSPESDLEKDSETEPMRRARTAQKSQDDVEEADDEYACQKCGKADHPEWILLCDTCDKGWHCSCLRPALMLIPEGDWFCPPCQHIVLVNKLRDGLKSYDQIAKRHENEVLRKKRLAFVGISLDNVLQKNERHRGNSYHEDSDENNDDANDRDVDSNEDDDSSSSSDSSGSRTSDSDSSSEESEPVYQLRERRCANTYKFNEYDDMINAAIQDEVEAVQGAGNQGRGKDISTIVNAEKEEAEVETFDKQVVDDDVEAQDKPFEKDSDQEFTLDKDDDSEDAEDQKKSTARKILARKKHRKLNSLDISSEDDPDSDEDFKGTTSDDEEDYEDQLVSSDDSSFTSSRRRNKGSRPVRRSTRAARKTRYDEDFINDDSDESDKPKRKKSKSMWEESESEESDNSWRQRRKRSKPSSFSRIKSSSKSKTSSKKKKKRKRIIEPKNESDNDIEIDEEADIEEKQEEEEAEEEEELQESPSSAPKLPIEKPLEESPISKTEVEMPSIELPANDQINDEVIPHEIFQKEEETTEHLSPALPSPPAPPSPSPPPPPLAEILQEPRFELPNICPVEIPVEPAVPLIEPVQEEKKERPPKPKKTPTIRRKIIYGGLPEDKPQVEEEEPLGRRTRGRKINYQVDIIMSDSEEELKKALRKTEESEDEFVVNEGDDFHDDGDKDSDSGDIYSPKKDAPKGKYKSPKNRRSKKSPASRKGTTDNGEPKQRKKPGPKPGSKNKPRQPKTLISALEGGVMGDVAEGSFPGLGSEELAGLDDEQLEQMMMEDEEYGRKQLELAAIEIAKNKKKEEREAKKLEKARLKALEILAAEQQRDSNALEGLEGEIPKKKKRGRRSKAEILAEQMRRDGAPQLTGLLVGPPTMLPNPIPMTVNPVLSTPPATTIPGLLIPGDTDRPSLPPTSIMGATEGHLPLIGGPDGQFFNPDGSPAKPKRRGRGKGKKTLALEAARAAEAAAKAGGDMSSELKSDDNLNVLPTPGSSTSGSAPSTPPAVSGLPSGPSQQSVYSQLPTQQQQSSVITRMLQAQPVSNAPQSFTAAAAAMGQKYFGVPTPGGPMMAGPRPTYDLSPRGRIPSPYSSRAPVQVGPMPPHFAAVRSGTPPMRMRVPGPTQLYHTVHHPMDPSPSGGGPISISSRDRASPLGPGPVMIPPAAGSPLSKGGPTPPPYVRGGPPLSRFSETAQLGPRHMPPFTSASPVNHSLQQPSPPPNRPPGNFSPYHPQPPPNYHYGAYPPPAPMSTGDDAAAYQGSPYSAEHFSSPADNPPTVQAPTPQSSQPPVPPPPHPSERVHGPPKQYDEEGTGEFGGLVSYFSSQREDDLDS